MMLKQMTLLTAAVQAWVSGALANNGLLLKMDTETDDMYGLASIDHATAEYRPVRDISSAVKAF